MKSCSIAPAFAALLVLACNSGEVGAQAKIEPSRGELLYTTHCVECHNARVHWREKKLATDWKTLTAQVRRWQGIQNLKWNNADINEVARYLNTFYYNYPAPGG